MYMYLTNYGRISVLIQIQTKEFENLLKYKLLKWSIVL